MGQKSNLVTLRKNKANLNLLSTNSKYFLYGYKFSEFFEKLLNKKNVLISSKTLNINNNQIFINFNFFFRTIKTISYLRITRKNRVNAKLFLTKHTTNNIILNKQQKLGELFNKQLKLLKTNLIVLNVKVLNNFLNTRLNKKLLITFLKGLKRFRNVLFDRRYNLFYDFLKVACLLILNKISSFVFLFLIGQIFRSLPKVKHTRFFLFLKTVCILLLNNNSKDNTKVIRGLKFIINGKLKGKTRASSICIQKGSIPTQSLTKTVDFFKIHSYTRYGSFGFKFWLFR